MTRWICLFLLTTILFGINGIVSAEGIHNPSFNYFSFPDSPFGSETFAYFVLENFEDGLLNSPGVTMSDGLILQRSDAYSDSVDSDDGFIDNNGNTGGATTGALYSAGVFSIQFDFDALVHSEGLPTHVGFVVTDALESANMTLSAFRDSQLLGSITGFQVSEHLHYTQEDRFYGWVDLNGIDSIIIEADTTDDWAMDHLQYGALPFQCELELAEAQQQIEDLQGQLAAITLALESGLASVQNDFRSEFSDPDFNIPGSTSLDKYEYLINAILDLNHGAKLGLYKNLHNTTTITSRNRP